MFILLKLNSQKVNLRDIFAVLVTAYDELAPFSVLFIAKRICNPMTSIQILTVSALIICLVSARERRMTSSFDDEDVEDDLLSCPIECDCKGYTVDCSNRGLKFVPKNIPSDARRV